MIKKFFTLLCLCTLCIGSAWGEETSTYTFSSKNWTSSVNVGGIACTWTGSIEGNQYNKSATPKGVQVCVGQTGVTITSSASFSNVKKVVIKYSSTKNAVGTIGVKIGTNAALTNQSVAKSQSGTTLTFTPSATQSGVIVATFNVSTNSYGIESIAVTYETSTKTLTSLAISGTPTKTTYTEGESFDPTGLTVTGYYDDETNAPITSGIEWTITPSGALEVGTTSVSVTATVDDVTSDAFLVDVTVNEKPVLPTYTLVTDASTLKAGDIIVIGATNDDNSYVAGALSGDYLSSKEATIENSILSASEAVEFTLGGEAGSWTLTSSEGTLGATAVKKLTYDNTKENFVDTWTISIDDGSATISSTGVSSTGEGYGRFLYNVNSPRFLTYTSITSASMLLPQIYRKEVSAKITSTGYATFSSDCALDLSNLPEGLTAYKATTAGNGKVHMVAVEEAVAANTGLFLEGAEGETYTIPVAASGTALDDNILKATTGEALAEGNYVYVIASGAFQPLGQATVVTKGKAYIPADAITSGGKLEISFDEPTGIEEVQGSKFNAQGAAYNLNGIRVNENYKGVVIMNGKKYMNK